MKDTFEEVYKNIGIAMSQASYWNIDSIVDKPDGSKDKFEYNSSCFKEHYVLYTDTDSGYIYLPYNNKYIKVFFYE